MIGVFAVAVTAAAAAAETGTSARDAACVRQPLDEFDPGLRAKQGSFKGRCLDASSVRPVVWLEKPQTGGPYKFANFYAQGRFWRALIPRDAVEKVYFQIVPFDSGVPLIQAAHTQFRFLFKKGTAVDLRSQTNGDTSTTDDFIISATYTAPAGEEYSALKSRGGSYGLVTRVLASLDRANEEILKDKSIVHQYELKMTPVERNRLLEVALHQSATAAYDKTYQLLDNNCTTVVFDDLDEVRAAPTGVPPLRGSLWNIRDEFIKPSLRGLIARHWIDDPPVEAQSMNSEMRCDPLNGPCTWLNAH